jgi:hypothetical protein
MFNFKKSGLVNDFALWKLPVVVSMIVVLLAAGVRWGSAQDADPSTAPIIEPQRAQGWGDEGIREVGVEWINDFPGTVNDRSHWDESCDGLYYGLTSAGWTGRFHFTDWNAWEKDFKRSALGGSENSYVDNVDIAMVCTHGSGAYDSFWDKNLSSVYFGSTKTDHDLSPGDAYHSYGDKDLEFLAFDSCSVLSDGGPAPYYNRGYWSTVMNGLHLLLGFKNTMYVGAPGDGVYWAMFMKGFAFFPPLTVTQSWFLATDYNQPTVTCARVLAETSSNYNEYLHGYGWVGADPVVDNYYNYWDHCSTGAKQLDLKDVSPNQPVLAVPVFQVVNRTIDEMYILDRIAPAFNISGTLGANDMFFFLVDTSGGITRTLLVDRVTGSYNFHNWGQLWTTPEFTPTLPLSGRTADLLANNYFSQTPAEGLPAAWYRNAGYLYNTEDLVQEMFMSGEGGKTQEISRIPADGMLTYGRNVSGPVQTTTGIQLADYPLVGPGGRLKIYFGDESEIIGVMGGSRDVVATKAMVEVMTAEEAWAMYLADPMIAIPEVPWAASYISYTSAVLGYYEMPYIIPQSELIPVWIYNANFYAPGMVLLAGDVPVYVPAALEYLPPQVTITEPISGTLFAPGELISFSGSVLGGKPPYTYTWSSSQDGFLGDVVTVVASLSGAVKGGDVLYHAIELQVVDANGQNGSATVLVKVMAPVYLPSIVKPMPK